MEPRAQRLGLARTLALPVRRRSARYGAGGDIAAQCPYLNSAGEMFAYVRLCSPMFAYVRLCPPMFAYVRLMGNKCLRPGESLKNRLEQTKSDQP
jgi:hypothetical protein